MWSWNNVVEHKEDADMHIVKCAVETTGINVNASVVADDTDAVLLLLYHWNDTMPDITITSEREKKATFGIKSSINRH